MIAQTVLQEKWNKGKAQIQDLTDLLESCPDANFTFKQLEQVQGFLCHLNMTFEVITPFLKGFYLSLCSHLSPRNDHGWKLWDRAFVSYINEKRERGLMTEDKARAGLNPPNFDDIPVPKKRRLVPRFRDDVFGLSEPPLVTVRSKVVYEIFYRFRDASGKGFSSLMLSKKGIKYQIGLWGPKMKTSLQIGRSSKTKWRCWSRRLQRKT
jgi:hypothetical protein